MKKYPVGRKDSLVVQEMDGEVLIYDLTENKAFCLNETSALVWQACDGTKSVAEIGQLISQKLNSPASEDLIWFAIDQLKKDKLIANESDLPENFAGMSRREVIKKVGLGTMIALPVVAGIVAPMAIHANSSCMLTVTNCTCPGLPPGQMYTTNQLCETASVQCGDVNCNCYAGNSGNVMGTCGF